MTMIKLTELPTAVIVAGKLAVGDAVNWSQYNLPADTQHLCELVAQMIAALPGSLGNPVGQAARTALIKYIEKVTPGTLSWGQGLRSDDKSAFSVFYGNNWQSTLYTDNVPTVTAKDSGWWQNFSLAVTCDAIYIAEVDAWDQIDHGAVSNDLATYNATLLNENGVLHALSWYTFMLQQSFQPFATPFQQLPDKAAALQLYTATLQSVEWQQDVLGKLANPLGNDPNDPVVKDFIWFLYHHWIKLSILGATTTAINAVASSLPPTMMTQAVASAAGANNWLNYIVWLFRPHTTQWQIDGNDILGDSRTGLRYSEGETPVSRFPVTRDVSASSLFIYGPARKYYHQSSGSCFSQGAMVRMHDGSLKAIEDVRSGDAVATPHGEGIVAFVSRPYRAGRSLYSINDHSFRFTSSHPFVHPAHTVDGMPTFLAIEPHRLARMVPTLPDVGIAGMRVGASLLPYQSSEGMRQAINTITTHRALPEDANQQLYDIVLEPDVSGRFLYFVGDERAQYLTASEIPLIRREPLAAIAVLQALALLAPVVHTDIRDMSRSEFEEFAETLVRAHSGMPELAQTALQVLDKQPAAAGSLALDTLEASVVKAMRSFFVCDPESGVEVYDWRMGRLFDLLMMHTARPLIATIDYGWCSPPVARAAKPTILALTAQHLSLSASQSEDAISLAITLNTAQRSQSRTLRGTNARSSTRFAYHFDEILYFDIAGEDTREEREEGPTLIISSQLVNSSGPGSASIPLVRLSRGGYQEVCANLLTANGNLCARLSLAARLLSTTQVAQEQRERLNWDDGRMAAFANVLGHVWGKTLAASARQIAAR